MPARSRGQSPGAAAGPGCGGRCALGREVEQQRAAGPCGASGAGASGLIGGLGDERPTWAAQSPRRAGSPPALPGRTASAAISLCQIVTQSAHSAAASCWLVTIGREMGGCRPLCKCVIRSGTRLQYGGTMADTSSSVTWSRSPPPRRQTRRPRPRSWSRNTPTGGSIIRKLQLHHPRQPRRDDPRRAAISWSTTPSRARTSPAAC